MRGFLRNRFYSAEDLEVRLGRKTASECTPLAVVRGRYWGGTIIDYLDAKGKRLIADMMDGKLQAPVDMVENRQAHRIQKKVNDDSQSGRQDRARYYKDTEP